MSRQMRTVALALSVLLAACAGTAQAASRGVTVAPHAAPLPAVEIDRYAAVCSNPQDAYENKDFCLAEGR